MSNPHDQHEQQKTDGSFVFGEWVVVTADDVDGFEPGTKALVVSSKPDNDGQIDVSRPSLSGSAAAVSRTVTCAQVTRDMSWRPLREEAALNALIEGIIGVTGSRIGRAEAIEVLDAIDAARAGEGS